MAKLNTRHAMLAELGFQAFGEYIRSPLFRSIRTRVIEAARGKCRSCGEPATKVRHAKFTRENLSGRSLAFLTPLCGLCFEADLILEQAERPTKRR
jgi:hypothetical protein